MIVMRGKNSVHPRNRAPTSIRDIKSAILEDPSSQPSATRRIELSTKGGEANVPYFMYFRSAHRQPVSDSIC